MAARSACYLGVILAWRAQRLGQGLTWLVDNSRLAGPLPSRLVECERLEDAMETAPDDSTLSTHAEALLVLQAGDWESRCPPKHRAFLLPVCCTALCCMERGAGYPEPVCIQAHLGSKADSVLTRNLGITSLGNTRRMHHWNS